MTAERAVALLASAVTGAAACAVLVGCSSGPDAQAQAQAQRSAVLPAAKKLYSQVTAAGVGWSSVRSPTHTGASAR